ncbi:hypothetical protein KFK09_012871 [Dendrobium nobile]|uniref:Uncharacterized protein n=1 Tax=Dendrobium nobile TaxID=94219 RepID=A0A8T3BIJ4_DENNO|nr:hypothetical protein KFK09_012871 [Dendrobium nobile]
MDGMDDHKLNVHGIVRRRDSHVRHRRSKETKAHPPSSSVMINRGGQRCSARLLIRASSEVDAGFQERQEPLISFH